MRPFDPVTKHRVPAASARRVHSVFGSQAAVVLKWLCDEALRY
jgi:hypothetical protein